VSGLTLEDQLDRGRGAALRSSGRCPPPSGRMTVGARPRPAWAAAVASAGDAPGRLLAW